MSVNLKIDISEETNGGRTPDEVLHGIDFADWHFRPCDNEELRKALENVVRSEMAEAIRNTWKWDEPCIDFYSDGETIHVTMNLGSTWNDGHIYWKASIAEMIDDYLWCTNPNDMAGGDDARMQLAKTLRDCASKLEAAIGKNVEQKTSVSESQPSWSTEFAAGVIADIEKTLRQTLTKRFVIADEPEGEDMR